MIDFTSFTIRCINVERKLFIKYDFVKQKFKI